jgi:hypothetical protein
MPEPRLPPMRWIAATLRETTETLARQLHMPDVAAPAWDRSEWRVARAVAAIHGISPLLATGLPWRGPEAWHEFLEMQRDHTRRRHERVLGLLARLDEAARKRGVSMVALKGAALHDLGIYQPGERPMSDIDLLVRPCDGQAAGTLIESLDYEFCFEIWKHAVFTPRAGEAAACIGEHADNPIKIELHTAIAEQLPFARCEISELILPQEQSKGVSFYRSRGALMAHLLIHAAGTMALNGMRALHLHDIARLARTLDGQDWDCIIALGQSGRLWWALPPIALTQRYFPGVIPDLVIEHAIHACAWPLRSVCARRELTDVSLSNPRIHAFPGFEWSRTPRELLHYVSSRVRPRRELLEMRKQYGKYQSLGTDAPWVRSSQLVRMARWACGSTARVDTMASVRAALTD